MAATNLDTDIYTGDVRVLELTIKDDADVAIDISAATGSDIYYVLQEAKDSTTNHTYYDLSSGIAFKTAGTDGVIQITVAAAATSSINASAGDLSYFHQCVVELNNEPEVSMEGTVTLKHRLTQVTNIDITEDDDSVVAEDITVDLPVGSFTVT